MPQLSFARFEENDKNAECPLVLVIDDHLATRKVLACMLSLQGYQPECVANGQEALEWIENAHDTKRYPAVILLDLLMPIMDGRTFLTCLHARWHALIPLPPILLLTVDHSDHSQLECTDVLLKPFHIGSLLEKLRRVLEKKSAISLQV
jgi:CheY-like chemotaxis protein